MGNSMTTLKHPNYKWSGVRGKTWEVGKIDYSSRDARWRIRYWLQVTVQHHG
jgi:hypothetical protein